MRPSGRRGGTIALVLCLYLALGSILLGAVTLAAAANAAAEREYRRSQAHALAEAGVTEALAGGAPHGDRPLGSGSYAWSREPGTRDPLIVARGRVESASGAPVTREIRARLSAEGRGSRIVAWEEGP